MCFKALISNLIGWVRVRVNLGCWGNGTSVHIFAYVVYIIWTNRIRALKSTVGYIYLRSLSARLDDSFCTSAGCHWLLQRLWMQACLVSVLSLHWDMPGKNCCCPGNQHSWPIRYSRRVEVMWSHVELPYMQWQLSVPKSGDSAGKLPPEALRSVYRPLRSGVGIEVALFPWIPSFLLQTFVGTDSRSTWRVRVREEPLFCFLSMQMEG